MSRVSQILLIGAGVIAIGAVAGEHVSRRQAERRYQQAVDARQQLELQFGEVLATHQQLQQDLGRERQRSHELTEALAAARAQLETAVGRLAEESRSARELEMRLSATRQQMDQLQGELAVTLQERQGSVEESRPNTVQLERIVVSDAQASALQGRILSVHRDWNFVVIDLGWQAVKIGDTVSIFRNEQLLAKARVERVQEGVCAAAVLPEWESAEIKINDLARIL